MRNSRSFQNVAPRDVSSLQGVKLCWIALFWLGHAPLAVIMHRYPLVATGHALIVLATGLLLALTTRRVDRILWVAAYVTGAEVLWRMCKASIPWEAGKYAVSAILLINGLRFLRPRPRWPLAYLLLLLPAAFVTLFELDFPLGRMYVSFNLSGPLSVAFCIWFFSGICLNRVQICNGLTAAIAPIIGVAAITLFTTYTATAIRFSTKSNFATSGGFGPNQVSAILGFGFLLTFFLFFLWPQKKWLFLAVAIPLPPIFLVQSAMTFSRTGLYLALGATLAGSLLLLRNPRARIGLVIGSTALALVAYYQIVPRLDRFTDGMLLTRFNEVSTTNRADILMDELAIWEDHTFFGVGAGMARFYRPGFEEAASHTEFSRLLAEHGLLGLAALGLLVGFCLRNYLSKISPINKALSAGLYIWVIGFLLASGMRMVAPAFALGLAFVVLHDLESRAETINLQELKGS